MTTKPDRDYIAQICRWIWGRSTTETEFSVSAANKATRDVRNRERTMRKVEETAAALDVLRRAGAIKRMPDPPKKGGRPPGPRYCIANPSLLATLTDLYSKEPTS